MIEVAKNPSVKFVLNKKLFNKLLTKLEGKETSNITEKWKEVSEELTDTLLRYSRGHINKNGDVSIIDIELYPNEASNIISLLISDLKDVTIKKDYTKQLKIIVK